MRKSRRMFLGSVSTAAVTGLTGCIGWTMDKVGLTNPVSRKTYSTTADKPAVEGQPTAEDGVPAAWGAIAHTPNELETLIDWDVLINDPDGPAEGPDALKDFSIEEQFVTVIVGILPHGDGLTGVTENRSDAHFEGDTVRFEVTNYQAFKPEPDDPQYHYDYTIDRWDRNGAQEPNAIEVNYHK